MKAEESEKPAASKAESQKDKKRESKLNIKTVSFKQADTNGVKSKKILKSHVSFALEGKKSVALLNEKTPFCVQILALEESLEEALADAELVVSVVPSHAVREVWTRAAPLVRPDALIVSGTKGIEVGTGMLVSQVLCQLLPEPMHERVAVLSGPSFAREIAEHRPTGVSIACRNEGFAIAAQSMISSPMFRCYSSTDVVGVELGGALKNVIALAVGFADGMCVGV